MKENAAWVYMHCPAADSVKYVPSQSGETLLHTSKTEGHMYDTLEKIRALLGVAEESIVLDFKAGAALENFQTARSELVKDVTAFANAGGGTIIYGIAEGTVGGRTVAGTFAPVMNDAVTKERIAEVISSNTDPVFKDFIIHEVADGTEFAGRIIAIKVEQGDTAYQNRIDCKYYARVDTTTKPMYGYAIRDVMNRRTHPLVIASVDIQRTETSQNRHRYTLIPRLENQGARTASHWNLRLFIPEALYHLQGGDIHGCLRQQPSTEIVVVPMVGVEYSSDRRPPASQSRLLPGETRVFGQGEGYPIVQIIISSEAQQQTLATEPALHWNLYVDDAPVRPGSLPFSEWCIW